MSLTLSYHAQTTVPVEIEGVVPDRLRDQSLAEIERLEAYQGNQKLVLADLFRISGDPADARIDFEGDLAGVHYIGYGMADGEIHVHGNAGRHLGSEMSGGRIEVEGDASDWVGGEMHGGLIRVAGSAGHLIGAAYRGSKRGMTDGTILIGGDVGNEIGAAVREQSGAGRDRPAVFVVGDRDHHPRRPGPNPGSKAQGAPRSRGRRRHHDLYAERELRDDVRAASFRHQGGHRDRRAGGDPRGNLRQDAARRARLRPRRRAGHPEVVRGFLFDPVAELPRRDRVSARPRSGRLSMVVGIRRLETETWDREAEFT